MKLKELIEKFEERKTIIGNYQGYAVWWEDVKEIFEQLDEPKPVKVKQFVAEHIKRAKEIGRDLQDAMNSSSIHEEVDQWLYTDNNMDTFARAWLDGYEVEEESKYIVKVKATGQCLGKYYINNEILSPRFIYTGRNADAFTHKELEEAGFGWVFDCSGIEVEEVEE